MPSILFLSDNNGFAEDLCGQIQLYAPEFSVAKEEDENCSYDIYILDEKKELLPRLREKHVKSPIVVLEKNAESLGNGGDLVFLIVKPFRLSEFLNNLRSCINKFENSSDAYLTFNKYELHPSAKEILNLRNNELINIFTKQKIKSSAKPTYCKMCGIIMPKFQPIQLKRIFTASDKRWNMMMKTLNSSLPKTAVISSNSSFWNCLVLEDN